jgi:hypothetical protein
MEHCDACQKTPKRLHLFKDTEKHSLFLCSICKNKYWDKLKELGFVPRTKNITNKQIKSTKDQDR